MRYVSRIQISGQCLATAFTFEFDIDARFAVKRIEHLMQFRDALAVTRIKGLNRLPGLFLQRADSVRGSFERRIVKHRQAAICQLDVKLDGIDTETFGKAKTAQRVLRRKSRRTAMANDDKLGIKAHTMSAMTYEVLARRLRPRSFDELIGQEHVVRVLRHALDHGRLHHAYLFTGTRGVGKTTIARILAKCMNCEQGVTATPCLTCASCTQISEGRFPDLVEVDAASRTRVEQTRELLENVPYAPTQGKYKVYLIDEVHMLSQSSFNALLKTLEEPPEHVRFLLATTDARKVPITVLSRCLQLQLKNLLPERISPYLKEVLEADGVAFDQDSIDALARAGRGSMRDALSLTDQAISYGSGALKANDVYAMLGAVSIERLDALMAALVSQDARATMRAIGELAELGLDFAAVLDQLTSLFHQAAVHQALQSAPSASHLGRLAAWDATELQLAYQIAITAARDLPLAPDPRCGFEMAMLRLLAFQPGREEGIRDAAREHPAITARAKQSEQPPSPSVQHSAPRPEMRAAQDLDWHALSQSLDAQTDPLVKQLARQAWVIDKSDERLVLGVDADYAPSVDAASVNALGEALAPLLGTSVTIEVRAGQPAEETPSQRDQRVSTERRLQAQTIIEADPFVRYLVEQFRASIVPESVQLVGANHS